MDFKDAERKQIQAEFEYINTKKENFNIRFFRKDPNLIFGFDLWRTAMRKLPSLGSTIEIELDEIVHEFVVISADGYQFCLSDSSDETVDILVELKVNPILN